MLVPQPRARQNHGREPRLGEMDGDAAGDKLSRARLEFDRLIDAGAQVQAGSAGGGIVRQIVLQARVEDSNVEFVHV